MPRSLSLRPFVFTAAIAASISCSPSRELPSNAATTESSASLDFGTREQPQLVSRLDGDSVDAWREHVWPSSEELAFEEIPWIPNFRDGLVEADAQGKPLLTWVMNGHPLGCT